MDRSGREDIPDSRWTRTLRSLPPRRAPGTLEERVLGEIRNRATLRWWQRSFAHWPPSARLAFIALCGAAIGVATSAGAWQGSGLPSLNDVGDMALARSHPATAVMTAAGGLAGVLAQAIPPTWLYTAMGVGGLLYAALFGLGVAAYRTLYRQT